MTGHLLGGADALETIFTVLALRERTAPPTINVTEMDPGLRRPRRPQRLSGHATAGTGDEDAALLTPERGCWTSARLGARTVRR